MREMKNKPSAAPVRHMPQRTCVACRKVGVKRELIRLVYIPELGVEVDQTGKKSGRGAYLCSNSTCWETALDTGKLEHALRVSIKPDNKERLVNYAKGFDNSKQILVFHSQDVS
jgi:uncharacterized protein